MRNIPRISGDFKNWHSELVKLVETDTTVDVYRNLHKGCWSVRQGGKVVAHCDYIVLRDARFLDPTQQWIPNLEYKRVHSSLDRE